MAPPRSDSGKNPVSDVAAPPGPPALSSSFWVGSRLGKYLLTAKLGSGTMGIIYEAQDPFLKRTVAIKLLADAVAVQPEAVKRFLHEARAASKLQHPNIVAVHEVDQQAGAYYIVMELLRGGSAQDFLDAQGPFAWPEATRILADVCRGVQAAHRAGLIHRDIKPAHIMRDAAGAVKLTDFGLAKVSAAALGPASHAGSIVGTPAFMSPEQCRADPHDERADLYALGATYYALLTGRPPYQGGNMQVLFAHCSADVPDPRAVNAQLPKACAAVVAKAMAKAPVDRYATAAALLQDLEALLAAAPAGALSAARWTGALPEDPEKIAPTPGPPVSAEALALLAPRQQPDELGRLGPYRVLRLLGEGGMGVVFQAEDPGLERAVALKVMKPDRNAGDTARQRFVQEAKAAAKLQHENIVTIYAVGEDRDVPYLAMQFLRGQALDTRLRCEGALPAPEILRLGREIAAGLAAAHNHGLIHRDIKPANIWLEDTGDGRPPRVKILDFGLARVVREDAQQLTRTGMVMGTPGYMAPEQARGGAQLDARCDLFSLGCVLYHMATGMEPFRREDTMATLMALALEEPTPIRQLNPEAPGGLVRIITALLMKRPGDRPASAPQVIELLEEVEREVAVAAPALAGARGGRPRPPAPPPPPPARLAELGLTSADDSTEFRASLNPEAASIETPASGHLQTSPFAAIAPESKADPAATACPRCGTPGLNPASRAWCLSCGYYPEPEKKAEEDKSKTGLDWLWILLAGLIVVFAISYAARTLLPHESYARTIWSTTQLVVGILAVIVGHVWAFVQTLPQRDDHKIFNYIDLSVLWRSTFAELPRTRRPLWLGCWGGVAILCAVFLVGGIPYLWTGLPKRLAARGGSGSESSGDYAPPDHAGSVAENELTGKDKDLEDAAKEKRFAERCTIIGYLEDSEGTITGLILAAPREGGLRFAGVVKSRRADEKPTKEEEAAIGKLTGAKLASLKPAVEDLDEQRVKLAALDPTAKVRWVMPDMSCDVDYAEVSAEGVLRDPVLKGW